MKKLFAMCRERVSVEDIFAACGFVQLSSPSLFQRVQREATSCIVRCFRSKFISYLLFVFLSCFSSYVRILCSGLFLFLLFFSNFVSFRMTSSIYPYEHFFTDISFTSCSFISFFISLVFIFVFFLSLISAFRNLFQCADSMVLRKYLLIV